MILTIATSGYRSLNHFVMPLTSLNVVTGPNGSGKSNVYRSLRLLGALAEGRFHQSLAVEGGFQSTLWAGPEKISRGMQLGQVPIQGTVRSKPIRMLLGFCAEPYSYAIDLGHSPPGTPFQDDADIKNEWLWTSSHCVKENLSVHRKNDSIQFRDESGRWSSVQLPISKRASILSELLDPGNTPEVIYLRESLRNWRFYDSFDTSPNSALRQPQAGCFTPALHSSGHDIAAALATIQAIGEADVLDQLFTRAFPESQLLFTTDRGYSLQVQQRGMLRPLEASELSDGTLRFICLLVALLTPRPPQLMVLNEPETSLHPDMIPALADLIQHYSQANQIVVVSHSQALVDQLTEFPQTTLVQLDKRCGQTELQNIEALELPYWNWPKRN